MMLFTALDSLLTLEKDEAIRSLYKVFLNGVLYPLVSYRRNPLADAMYVAANGGGDLSPDDFENAGNSLKGRIAAVLGQYPDPTSSLNLPNVTVPSCAKIEYRFPGCEKPECKRYSFEQCHNMRNPFYDTVKRWADAHGIMMDDTHYAGLSGLWALGQGIVLSKGVHLKTDVYRLVEEKPCHGDTFGGVFEPAAYDYLYEYWYAVSRGVLAQ
jgi:hypothetical protein